MRNSFWFIFLITLVTPYFTYCQQFDSDFSINLISPESPWVADYYRQNDGKLIVVSEGLYINGYFTGGITRFNSDYTLDTSFSSPFLTVRSSPGCIALQSDGKIIVSGAFEPNNDGVVVRLNIDGSIDEVLVEGIINPLNNISVAVDSRDNIFVFGSFYLPDYTESKYLLKLLPEGDVDHDFYNNGIEATAYANLIIQEDDKILIAGTDNKFNNVYRINTDGTINTDFNYPYSVADVRKIHRINNQYIITGRATNDLPGIARLNDDGSFDNTFIYKDELTNYALFSAIQTDGKILIGHDKYIYRLHANGAIDNSFTPVYFSNHPRIPYFSIPILPLSDDSFLTQYLRLINSKSEALSIPNLIPGSFPHVTSITLNHQEKLVFAGQIDGKGSFAYQPIMIMDEQGNVDPEFLIQESYFVNNVGEYDNGEYLISARKSNPNGPFFKLDSKGKVDLKFKARDVVEEKMPSGIDGLVQGFEKQADGKILVYGNFDGSFQNSFNKNIVRLNEDGTIDNTFKMLNSLFSINDILILPHDEAFVAGSNFRDDPICHLIEKNGKTLYYLFNKGDGNRRINKMKIDQSGNIYFAGYFSKIGRYNTSGLIKFTPDFEIDTTFKVVSGNNETSFIDFEILENGKILAVGQFENSNLVNSDNQGVVLLNADGSVDESFRHNFYWLGIATEIFSSKKHIYVGGQFVQDESFTSSGLIRFEKDYLGEEPEDPEEPIIAGNDNSYLRDDQLKIYPNPASKSFTINLDNTIGGRYELNIINALGQIVYSRNFLRKNVNSNLIIPVSNYGPGIYQIRLIGEKNWVQNLIVR